MLDHSSPNPDSISRSALFIQSFLSSFRVSDVWRSLHTNMRTYSFFSHVHHTFTRIDYFFIDNELIPLACSWDASTLLSDNDFVNFMKEQISFLFQKNTSPDTASLVVWDALKAYLRGQIISYTANMKKRPTND